jgi:hypothetical protein
VTWPRLAADEVDNGGRESRSYTIYFPGRKRLAWDRELSRLPAIDGKARQGPLPVTLTVSQKEK